VDGAAVIFGSLFTGIGGMDPGLERAGMACAWQVELDPFCRRVLEKHWPGVPRHDDVRTFDPTAVDLVAGGFPCQPVSFAGKRRGEADPRWLWPEFLRVVRACRPAWVLAENVPGLRTCGADRVLGDLESEGYAVAPLVVGADHAGAPHIRRRVWIVAHAGHLQWGLQPGRRNGQSGADPAVVADDGNVANAARGGCEGSRLSAGQGRSEQTAAGALLGGEALAHADRAGLAQRGARGGDELAPAARGGWWQSEPDVGRVAHGVPARVDRLRALGNACVPQVVEEIGRAILNSVSQGVHS